MLVGNLNVNIRVHLIWLPTGVLIFSIIVSYTGNLYYDMS